MGLDMYMYAQKEGEDQQEIAYWRKHNALHHWFEQHWQPDDLFPEQAFNCVEMPVDQDLLNELRNDIKQHRLIPTDGFFFGTTEYDPAEYETEDLEALDKAEQMLKEGWDVYYNSWW